MKFRVVNFFKKLKFKRKLNLNNSVVLYTSGYNLERYLNMLCSKNIEFLAVEKLNPKDARIEVLPSDESEVVNFLKGKNIRIIDIKYNGFSKVQKFFKVRYGILIGVFLAFCFFVISSNYVWKIEILGNETKSRDEIISILNDNGVNIFDALNTKTNEEIERIILDNLDEVSMVSVIKKGTTIIVNIKEKLLNDEHENKDNYSALLATNDGIITNIDLIQGTLLVKVGDTIRVGDKLVAPYITDSSGNKIPIEPKANIYADVWLAGQSIHFDIKNVVERTGNVIKERKVICLGQELYSNSQTITFDSYETEIYETYLTDYLIPIKYQTIVYYETVARIIEQPFSGVEEEKIAEARGLANLRIKEGEEIKSENHIITSAYGKTTVSYVITVSRKIS